VPRSIPESRGPSAINAFVRFVSVAARIALLVVGFPCVALGERQEEPLRLEYRASPGCDGELEFLEALRSRAPSVRLAQKGEQARVFTVEIEQAGDGTRARLTIREPNGQRTVRDLEAKDCRDAIDALSLVAALAVDPEAPTRADPRPPTPDATPARAREQTPGREPLPLPIGSAWSWRWSVALSGRGGIAPAVLPGSRLGVEIDRNAEGWFAPTVRAWAEYAPPASFELAGGVAQFSYATGSLEMCPLRTPGTSRLLARSCVVTDVGVVFARGAEVPNPRSADRLWMALGLQARLEWLLTARIAIELDVGCNFPLWRDRFRFDPRLIYEVAGIGGAASLGATMHFP
jgi:hypothetical protein